MVSRKLREVTGVGAANDDDSEFSNADLEAYVLGRLPVERRADIEGFLACNPDLAAGVMAALHRSRRQSARAPRPERRPLWAGASFLAAGAAGVAIGLLIPALATGSLGKPGYLDDAVISAAAINGRSPMNSQPEVRHVDRKEIAMTTGVELPSLPSDWQVEDVQIFPADAGLSVSMLVRDELGQSFNLFALKADTLADGVPDLSEHAGVEVAYWESGGSAFVLNQTVKGGGALLRTARRLSSST